MKMNVLKPVRFNWCLYLLAPKLIADILALIYISPGIIILGKIPEHITFIQLSITGSLLAVIVYLGFLKYGVILRDNKFNLLIGAAIILLLLKTVLITLVSYRYFYFLLVADTIVPFLLFIAFWFIKEKEANEELNLARWFRNSFFCWLVMISGHRVMVAVFSFGKALYSAGCLLQGICFLFILYRSVLLFKKLRLKYE